MAQDVPGLRFLSRISGSRRPALTGVRDIRGYRVLDIETKEVGRVSDLLVDPDTCRVRFVEIRTSGPGERTLLVPFNKVTVVGRDRVVLPARLAELEEGRR